ncbi:hypothetical protein CP02DC23_0622B, partial [Chlamydia psittaci 02DC23]
GGGGGGVPIVCCEIPKIHV